MTRFFTNEHATDNSEHYGKGYPAEVPYNVPVTEKKMKQIGRYYAWRGDFARINYEISGLVPEEYILLPNGQKYYREDFRDFSVEVHRQNNNQVEVLVFGADDTVVPDLYAKGHFSEGWEPNPVPGIVKQAAAVMGRKGGSSKSPVKQAAARANGAKGGRRPAKS